MLRAYVLPALLAVPLTATSIASCGGKLTGVPGDDVGPDGSPDVAASDASPDTTVLPDAGFDAPLLPDSPLNPPDASPPPANPQGYLIFEDGRQNGSQEMGFFYGQINQNANGLYAGCTVIAAAGACTTYACPGSQPIDAGPTESAGDLRLTGGQLPAGGVVISPAPTNPEYEYGPAGPLFAPGDTLTVGASGAAVPAFSASVPATNSIVLTRPSKTASGYVISTAQDLALSWNGGTPAGRAWIELFSTTAPGQVFTFCDFDASPGYGTALQPTLAPLRGSSSGILVSAQIAAGTIAVGPYAIQVGCFDYDVETASFQ